MKEIIDELKEINYNIGGILEIMRKSQKTKLMKVLDSVGAGVGILGIIIVADVIRNWILGG